MFSSGMCVLMGCILSNNASILKSAQDVRLMERCYQDKSVVWICTEIMSRARRRMKRVKKESYGRKRPKKENW
jgi:hypothetical protein